jgi:4-hydroxy-3-polyprenylbenzoate decarboxylase
MRRLVVGMTGATGAILGVRLLSLLRDSDVECHLVLSKWAGRTIEHETSYSVDEVRAMAAVSYAPGDMGAAVSSGSFVTEGMVIVPCSMRSVASIASGAGEHLVHRAADVVLKERRRLVIVARESPLSQIHLENLLKLARMGAAIVPPMPAFYNHPKSIEYLVDHIVMRVLDQFDIHIDAVRRWDGRMRRRADLRPVD